MPEKSSDTGRASSDPTELERAIRACRSAFAACAMFSLAINVLMLTLPIYMLQVYDRVLTTGRVETLVMLTLIATIALAVMCALDALRTAITIRVGCWLNEQLGPAYLACAVRGRLQGDLSGAEPLRDISQIQKLHRDAGLDRFLRRSVGAHFRRADLDPPPDARVRGGLLSRGLVSVEHRERDGHTQGQPDSEPQADRGDAVGRCDDPQRRDRASHAHVASHDRSLGGCEWNGHRRLAPFRRRRGPRARDDEIRALLRPGGDPWGRRMACGELRSLRPAP